MTSTSALPLVAITLGDPVGVGPEVVAKVLTAGSLRSIARTVVIGSVPVLDKALALVDSSLSARSVDDPSTIVGADEIAVYETNAPDGLADTLP
jgi:4-hydroxy-L-threonine phosphate dehydrogenase PdxA